MNPDKLFDYLDGKLDPYERESIEQQLATDGRLQRELAMARQIHSGMRGSREVILPPNEHDQQRAGRIGRGVATAFILLVLLNVFIGIAFIVGKNKPRPRDNHVEQQISAAAVKAGETVLPPPTIADEIVLFASAAERAAVADKVIAMAAQVGGSAAKALPNDQITTVIAEIPGSRENDFRLSLVALGAAPPAGALQSNTPVEQPPKKLLQVQIKSREISPLNPQSTP